MRLVQAGINKPPLTMAVPMGCDKCDQTGYKGRIGIYELLRLDDSIRAIVRNSGSMDDIRGVARSNGMRTMQEDALEKLRNGLTTSDEIFRVVPVDTFSHMECSECNCNILASFKFCPSCGTRCQIGGQSTRTRTQIPVEAGVQS